MPVQDRLAAALGGRQPLEGPADQDTQRAAVAVILSPDPDAVLLIRRAERVGDPWSGHLGLPGGRVDPDDPDLCATAMRETVEEVGCVLSRDRLLGVLDDVWPRSPLPRLIIIRPFVFGLADRPPLAANSEVADAFWVPLAELRDPTIYRDATVHLRGESRVFPAYHLSQGVVWGLTERILTPLLELL
ncbi:MAG: CoA pyrophosphatase [Gemmatimonadales bacterium]|jgi:8-oxo-dGTP pyrophosphatase MutT (NUDIX family)|nr:CoA pyrophosphatase [Gemmatimonadales bacterium]